MQFDPDRCVGYESAKLWRQRCESGFWNAFIRGPNIIDIGYRGGTLDAVPLHECAHGFESGDYDGLNLPFPDGWADACHCSHLIEHVAPPEIYIQEWYRVLKPGGHMILFVPHAYLYERRLTVPPSRFSSEHLKAYSPASLLGLIERSLEPNTYRIRHFKDQDSGYDYSLPKEQHPVGALEMELVIERITPPAWTVDP